MKIFFLFFLLLTIRADAQLGYNHPAKYQLSSSSNNAYSFDGPRKLFQRNTGIILGLQNGRNTLIEMGGEAHWRKISLTKPHIIGATANMEYNFADNVIGYKTGVWMKRGRINFTYGANLSYHTNFKDGHRFGAGPSIGFRLLGFHLINGYTFLTKDKTPEGEKPVAVNSLYMSLRYYFPVENKFTWDRKTMKKKREKKKAREKRKKERIKEKENKEKKDILNLFRKKESTKD